jgi:hypothetical protein
MYVVSQLSSSDFALGKRKKSIGPISGEYGRWWQIVLIPSLPFELRQRCGLRQAPSQKPTLGWRSGIFQLEHRQELTQSLLDAGSVLQQNLLHGGSDTKALAVVSVILVNFSSLLALMREFIMLQQHTFSPLTIVISADFLQPWRARWQNCVSPS